MRFLFDFYLLATSSLAGALWAGARLVKGVSNYNSEHVNASATMTKAVHIAARIPNVSFIHDVE